MPLSVRIKNGTVLELESKAFDSGGEGELYRITNPVTFQNQVVKIYKPEKRTKERENKIEFLAANPPALQVHDGHHSIIWVNDIVYENGKFCGFTMPFAKGKKLEFLCHPTLPKTLSNEWAKFDFKDSKSSELRLKLCFNIAVALYQVHKLDNYVLIDMKPDNIKVQSNGLISLIDIDSIAVIKNNKILFPASVATPEYTPPEFYKGIKPNENGLSETWDRFSIAVIFYRLLFGIHPFTGTCISPYENCTCLADMVQNGLFANGLKSPYFKIVPPPHNKFKSIQSVIQDLFKRCFDEGHSKPYNRPSADEWCRTLVPQQAIQINRPLPSSLITYPLYNYSKAIIYNPNTSIASLNINYKNPKSVTGLKWLWNGLFGKTKEQQLVESVKQLENELQQKEKKYEYYVSELQNILETFSQIQETVLTEEKQKIELLKNSVITDVSYFDQQAKELYNQEANEMRIISNSFTISSNDLEQKLKQAHNNFLSKRIENHEIEKSILQKSFRDLQLKKNKEIDGFINEPTKLSKYLIKNASIYNLGYNSIQSLASVGIVTAADFTDISSDGYLKNRFGKWVKASGVGWSRVHDLRKWQQGHELKENQIITERVNQNYSSQFISIDDNLKRIEALFQNEIQPYQAQYNNEKKVCDEEKTKLVKNYKEKVEEVKKKYDKLYSSIIDNTKIYVSTILPKTKLIAIETEINLQENFRNHEILYTAKKIEINDYKNKLTSAIQKLNELHQQFLLK